MESQGKEIKGAVKAPPRFGVAADVKPSAPLQVFEQHPKTAPVAAQFPPEKSRQPRIQAVSIEAHSPAAPILPPTVSPMAGIPLTTDPARTQPFTVVQAPVAMVSLPSSGCRSACYGDANYSAACADRVRSGNVPRDQPGPDRSSFSNRADRGTIC